MIKEFTLQDVFNIIVKRLWLFIAFALIGGIIAFTYSNYFIAKRYTAKASFYVYNGKQGENSTINQNLTANDFMLSNQIINTYLVILKSRKVLEEVSEDIKGKYDLEYTAGQIAGMISTAIVDETEVFSVSVSNTHPKHAKIICDAIADVAPNEIIRVVKAGAVEIIDSAQIPTSPSFPNKRQNTMIGFILGIALAAIIAFLLEILNTSVKTKEELIEKYDYPVLTTIPSLSNNDQAGGRYSAYNGSYGYGYGYEYKQSKKEDDK